MSIPDILIGIENSAIAHAVSKSNHLVGAGLQVVHVVGIILLLASLVLLCLRLMGLALRDQAIDAVGRDARRLFWAGFALASTSGTLMFVATPRLYFYNAAFQLKMALFAIAVLAQVLLLQRVASRNDERPAVARTAAAVALTLWFSVGLSGRVIGFI